MGFFSSIKKNLNHGGVKVHLDAPASIHWDNKQYTAKVTITAKEPQTINSVRLELLSITYDSTDLSNDNAIQTGSAGRQDVLFETTNQAKFELGAGETKVVEIPFGIAAVAQSGNETLDAIAGIMGKVSEVAAALDKHKHEYTLTASVDVEGIKLDPSNSMNIKVLKPGEIGTNMEFHT